MKKGPEFPPVPDVAFSLLGPVKVLEKKLDGLFGITEYTPRTITLDEGQHPALAWSVFWHEVTHLVLFDAGVKLPPKDAERVCDAFGTYLAAAVRSGYLKVTP